MSVNSFCDYSPALILGVYRDLKLSVSQHAVN